MTLQPVNKVSALCCWQFHLLSLWSKYFLPYPLRRSMRQNFAFWFCSTTRRLYFYLIWALSRTGSLLNSSVKLSQLVTQAHMVDFLFLVEQQRRYFLPWFVYLYKMSSRKEICFYASDREILYRTIQCNRLLKS